MHVPIYLLTYIAVLGLHPERVLACALDTVVLSTVQHH